MSESALLQILSIAGIGVGILTAGISYWAITQELKRAEPNSNLAQALWVVVAGGLLVGLFGVWGQIQLYNAKKNPVAAAPAPSASSTQVESVKSVVSQPTAASPDLAVLQARLNKLEANVAKYRELQNAFARNREKWQDVLDKAAVIAGPIRPDVQNELKQIREQLGTKLVEEDK